MTMRNFFTRESGSSRLWTVAFALSLVFSQHVMAVDRVVGANASLDIEPGARSAALGSATMAVDEDYLGLLSNPYQLSHVEYSWVNFSHTAYYEDTKYDFASGVIPLGDGQALGIAISRFGADDIPWITEGSPLPEGENYNTLSMADWIFSVSWGRRLTDRLDLGVSFHGLYREMDQTGYGFRSDAGVRFKAFERFYVAGLLKGWTSSATSWSSGEFEYSSPEFYVAANYSVPISYLYGTLGLYWQGAGLLHREARGLDFDDDESGKRIWEDPVDWLSGGRVGAEFNFDFGLSLRVGLSSLNTYKSLTAGAGVVVAKFLKVDYAFESHPVLTPVHRVSLSVCPYLFFHAPKKKSSHLSPSEASKKVLSEEPELDETLETQDSTAVKQEPVVEDDSPSESRELAPESVEPAGGVYWEE